MDNPLKVFTSVLAITFAILFVFTSSAAFTLFSVEQSAFDAEHYIRALEEENVYQRLPELTAQVLAVAAQRPGRNDVLSLFKNLSEEQWQVFILELFPSDELRNVFEEAIRQIMAYLNGESDQAILTLANLKAHMGSPQGINAIYGLVQSQPDCTVEQLTAMAMGQQGIVLCNPPETFLFLDLRPIYEAEIQAIVALVPEQVTLVSAGSNRAQELQDLRFLRTVIRLSPVLPILFFFLITILTVRSLGDWLNWWGYPLLFAGLLSIALSAMSAPLATGIFQLFIAPALPASLPPDIPEVFRDLTATIVRNAVRPALFLATIMTLVGLIMVALTLLLRTRLQKNPVNVDRS